MDTRKIFSPKTFKIIIAIAITAGVIFFTWETIKNNLAAVRNLNKLTEQHHIYVFIHGTFGLSLALYDFAAILKDDLTESYYASVLKNIRKNPFFYRSQVILQKGLAPITPSFKPDSETNFCAAYHITKVHEELVNYMSIFRRNLEKRHYYTFGWDGLLSQKSRRIESVRLYNALHQEIQKFLDVGITPKITIFAHSHGGNVALNLAGIWEVAHACIDWGISDQFLQQATLTLNEYCQKLPARTDISFPAGPKAFDYYPEPLQVPINRLVLFGTPIQPETDQYAFAPLFEKVFNVYSLADPVQLADGLSTSRPYSEQLFSRIKNLWIQNGKGTPSGFYQVKITIEENMASKTTQFLNIPLQEPWRSWKSLFGNFGSSLLTHDPTHKEFWFLVESSSPGNEFSHPLHPFPLVSYSPIFLDLIEQQATIIPHNLHVNIRLKKRTVFLDLMPLKSSHLLGRRALPFAWIRSMAQQVPLHNLPAYDDEDIVSKHLEDAGVSGIDLNLQSNYYYKLQF